MHRQMHLNFTPKHIQSTQTFDFLYDFAVVGKLPVSDKGMNVKDDELVSSPLVVQHTQHDAVSGTPKGTSQKILHGNFLLSPVTCSLM